MLLTTKPNSKEKIFYVYVDLTNENVPRPFYIGKGLKYRVENIKPRNKKWKNIASKYGFIRQIICGTLDESFAFEMEITLIKLYKTFEADWADNSGWGANFTRGGEGASGLIMSDEAKNKISVKQTGSGNSRYRAKVSIETRQKMSLSRSGPNNPFYQKYGDQHPSYGRKMPTEKRLYLSIKSSGEGNNAAKLTWEQVNKIREFLSTNQYSQAQIAQMFGITQSAVRLIFLNKRWII